MKKELFSLRFCLLLAGSMLFAAIGYSQTITTVVGDEDSTWTADGVAATSTGVRWPSGLLFDSVGNLFVADYFNRRVREVNATTGIITTFAGNGTNAFSGDGGQATDAETKNPFGIAKDSYGNIYFTDYLGGHVRKVDISTGIITTIAGNNGFSDDGDGGPAVDADIYFPMGLAIDKNNNIYIADFGGSTVRKIDAVTGIITTVAGQSGVYYQAPNQGDGGQATAGALDGPYAVAIDTSGQYLYIADQMNNCIRMVDFSTGIITTVAGTNSTGGGYSGDGGPATVAEMNTPEGITVDAARDLYIADFNNNVIRKVDASTGFISTIAGNGTATFSGDGGPATSASLSHPVATALDANGNLYISDQRNNRVRKITQPCTTVNPGTITALDGQSFCGSGADTLTLIGASSGSDVYYQWIASIDGTTWANIGNNTTSTPTGTISATTFYEAVVYCMSSSTYDTTAIDTITVNSTAVPTISVSADPGTSVSVGTTVTFTAAVTNSGSNPTYQWFKNNGSISGATTNTYITNTLANGDIITCSINSNNTCADPDTAGSSPLTMQITDGVAQLSSLKDVSLYPNPNSGVFNIAGHIDGKTVQVKIQNVLGQVVYAETLSVTNGQLDKQIILPGKSASGVYLLSIKTATASGTMRFMINNE